MWDNLLRLGGVDFAPEACNGGHECHVAGPLPSSWLFQIWCSPVAHHQDDRAKGVSRKGMVLIYVRRTDHDGLQRKRTGECATFARACSDGLLSALLAPPPHSHLRSIGGRWRQWDQAYTDKKLPYDGGARKSTPLDMTTAATSTFRDDATDRSVLEAPPLLH